jgi:DNA-binding CsgD family transcriptional regulator
MMGRLYTRLGLPEKIAPWLRKEKEAWELNVLFRGFDTLIKAESFFIEKNYSAALQSLKQEQVKSELGTFLFGFLEMTALEAVTRHQLNDREGAFSALKRAYDAAAPNALNTPFIELGDPMSRLIGALLKVRSQASGPDSESAGIPGEWLQSIRRSASAFAKKRNLVAAHYPGWDTPLSSDFSQHELAILRSLALGCTSKEIAGDMKISVKMVKSAIRSLYVKLEAANRADAIRIATAKGLLK